MVLVLRGLTPLLALIGFVWHGGGPLPAQALGTISTVAGYGAAAFTGDGGAATDASLNNPTFVAFAPDGTGSQDVVVTMNGVASNTAKIEVR